MKYERRKVPGYGDKFEVDTDGEVYGPAGSRLKPRTRGGSSAYNGGRNYLSVAYRDSKTGKNREVYVHQLVMAAFDGPYPKPKKKWEIHHKDEDKWNNRPGNLEYRLRRHNRILPHTGEEVPF